MMNVDIIELDGHLFKAISVPLPKTNLLVVTGDQGYIMCGALDVGLLNEKLADRGIIAGRALGVRSIDDLLEAPLESVTVEAEKRGVYSGMVGKDALLQMHKSQ